MADRAFAVLAGDLCGGMVTAVQTTFCTALASIEKIVAVAPLACLTGRCCDRYVSSIQSPFIAPFK
jgi:hypothetical protein